MSKRTLYSLEEIDVSYQTVILCTNTIQHVKSIEMSTLLSPFSLYLKQSYHMYRHAIFGWKEMGERKGREMEVGNFLHLDGKRKGGGREMKGRELKERTPYLLQTKLIQQWIYLDEKHTTVSLSFLSLPSPFFPFLPLPAFSFPSLPKHPLLPFSSRMLPKHIFKLSSSYILFNFNFILFWCEHVMF